MTQRARSGRFPLPPPETEEEQLDWYSLEMGKKVHGLKGQGLRRMV
jgi:hypothetical protein